MQIPWVEGGYFNRIDLSYFEGGGKGTEKVENIEQVEVLYPSYGS